MPGTIFSSQKFNLHRIVQRDVPADPVLKDWLHLAADLSNVLLLVLPLHEAHDVPVDVGPVLDRRPAVVRAVGEPDDPVAVEEDATGLVVELVRQPVVQDVLETVEGQSFN